MILHFQLGNKYPEAVDSVIRLFHRPLFGLDQGEDNLLVRLHFRYAVEFLIQERLLTPQGEPINLCGLITHLFWSEPANFLFLSLLREGLFERICAPIFEHKPDSPGELEILKQLLLILSHLFERLPVHRSKLGVDFSKIGPSKVILEKLPDEAAQILEKHNERSLKLFYSCAQTVAFNLPVDNTLPASKICIPNADESSWARSSSCHTLLSKLEQERVPFCIRTAFIANSGHGDNFGSLEELHHEARHEAYVHRSAIPTIPTQGIRGKDLILNRYALDFFTHGQFKAMTVGNGLYGGQSWELLDGFKSILSAISMALRKLATTAEQMEGLLKEEREGLDEPLRRVSDHCVVQAFFRLSTVFSTLFKPYHRR